MHNDFLFDDDIHMNIPVGHVVKPFLDAAGNEVWATHRIHCQAFKKLSIQIPPRRRRHSPRLCLVF